MVKQGGKKVVSHEDTYFARKNYEALRRLVEKSEQQAKTERVIDIDCQETKSTAEQSQAQAEAKKGWFRN